MKLALSILVMTVGSALIGWNLGVGKSEIKDALPVSVMTYLIVVVFMAVGMFIKYKWW